jgi:hypothetical protein
MVSEHVSRPSILRAVRTPKSWGEELWLTSTRPEAPAVLGDGGGTFAALVQEHPEVLGAWSRRLFGDEMPIFAKTIRTDFPSRVHVGFRRTVERPELLGWLVTEQDHVRELLHALRVPDATAFSEYQARYSAWASRQALAAWRLDDDADTFASLRGFVDSSFDLPAWLRRARANRATFADALNEVDLIRESGRLLLMGAGTIHAIYGLSHQTHPLDHARTALERLFGVLAERARGGATDEELARVAEDAGLSALRAQGGSPPKNEGWLPTSIDGTPVLVEPQQTSDTTRSLADFYTPLVWGKDGACFRKGEPREGLSQKTLTDYLADVDVQGTSVDALRRIPHLVPGASRAGAELYCLVDEPARWPFFTAYQLELRGTFAARPADGVFQELVVTRGRVDLGDDAGPLGELSPRSAAFVPATLRGSYTLKAREAATVLLFGVPGARGGAPRI